MSGRRTADITITDKGRDQGKVFHITEMSASQGEAWAMRVLMALMRSNVELPEGFANLGMAGLAQLGFKALSGLSWEVASPLLREMIECVQVRPDKRNPHVLRPLEGENGDYDIEEIATRVKLRIEVWKLHTDFLEAVMPSLTTKVAAAQEEKSNRTATSRK